MFTYFLIEAYDMSTSYTRADISPTCPGLPVPALVSTVATRVAQRAPYKYAPEKSVQPRDVCFSPPIGWATISIVKFQLSSLFPWSLTKRTLGVLERQATTQSPQSLSHKVRQRMWDEANKPAVTVSCVSSARSGRTWWSRIEALYH
jgi:hypothetical protein